MPLDAICMTALAQELRSTLLGGKIDKIYQPTRDEVVLHMRTGQGNVRLLLSANPQHPRAHITAITRENPDTPPMFCMLLRKSFVGGRLLELRQPSMERLLDFRFETLSELGDRMERRLVLECIGRKSNLVMLDGAGLPILVGKNNSQNDRLTLREADKRDIWLHVQKLHGSHVILCTGGAEPDGQSLTEAAMLAAWFSQGKDSAQVPVDYTPVRVVKKPAGAKPGFVVYATYRTLYVTPDEALVKKLRVK